MDRGMMIQGKMFFFSVLNLTFFWIKVKFPQKNIIVKSVKVILNLMIYHYFEIQSQKQI